MFAHCDVTVFVLLIGIASSCHCEDNPRLMLSCGISCAHDNIKILFATNKQKFCRRMRPRLSVDGALTSCISNRVVADAFDYLAQEALYLQTSSVSESSVLRARETDLNALTSLTLYIDPAKEKCCFAFF